MLGVSYLEKDIDNENLYYAAEAVVQAAICCNNIDMKYQINEEAKELLIRAVMEDPLITGALFCRKL